jgi:hypothetical protein
MIDFISLEYYTPFYYYTLFAVVLFTLLHTLSLKIESSRNKAFIKFTGHLLLAFVILYMGLRPISGFYFGDMRTYANIFEGYAAGDPITSLKDPLFHLFMQASSKIMGVHTFFLLCATLYVFPLYIVCKKWFKNYWFYGFLMLVTALSFWAYGVNGIRNGIAGSLFLLGISRDKRIFQILWLFLAANFHLSILLPILLFIGVQFYNKPRWSIVFWFMCIPLSLLFGGLWENIFANLGFEDDRFSYFIDEVDASQFRAVGFRWDFLLYSAVGVFAGWYFIFKRKFQDPVYYQLFNIYVLANAFWILVIRANFSNRFAYLSWFMMGLVLIYPLLKQHLVKNQHKKIGLIILIHFLFTFLMSQII